MSNFEIGNLTDLEAIYSEHLAVLNFLSKFKLQRSVYEGTTQDIKGLLDDSDFIELESSVTRFNPFFAMGLDQREVPHSNVLAFLMSPLEPHGLGMEILTRIFPAFAESRPENIVVLRESDLADASQRRLDVLAYDPVRRHVAIIEVKVKSKQGLRQLEDYRTWAMKRFGPDWHYSLLYLTNKPMVSSYANFWAGCDCRSFDELRRDANFSDDDERIWSCASFSDLSHTLLAKLSSDDANLSLSVGQFIRDYVSFIGFHISPLQGCFSTAARNILRRHSQAISSLLLGRNTLRHRAIEALAPNFAEMGLSAVKPRGAGLGGYSLQFINDHPTLSSNVSLKINAWGPTPSIMVDLNPSANLRYDLIRKAFKYSGSRNGQRRIVSFQLDLPNRESPFPLSAENFNVFVDHMKNMLAEFNHKHLAPAISTFKRA